MSNKKFYKSKDIHYKRIIRYLIMINFSSNWYTLIYLFKHSSILCHILSTILYTHGVIRLSVPYTNILEILRRISGRRLSLTIPVTIPELVNPFLSFFSFSIFFCFYSTYLVFEHERFKLIACPCVFARNRLTSPCTESIRRVSFPFVG